MAVEEPVGIASITASELLHGIHGAATAAQRLRRETFVERRLAALPVFPFDLATARIHASLWASLASKGASPGSHDLLIGATAMALGYRVVTRERRRFGKIPGLEVVILMRAGPYGARGSVAPRRLTVPTRLAALGAGPPPATIGASEARPDSDRTR